MHTSTPEGRPRGSLPLELPVVLLAVWLAFISIPLLLGQFGLSWDALNHHIYLGWEANQHRFDRDFLAAGYQGYQYPYLYWPVYKLAVAGVSGVTAGVVLATLHMVAVPPVWMIARTCMPGGTLFDAGMRSLAVVLAFLSGVVLSLFDSSSNDLLAAAPLVWAMAFALEPLRGAETVWRSAARAIFLSGLFAGVATAFKLSNGPLAVLFPLLWLLCVPGPWRARGLLSLTGCAGAVAGFVLAYGYWGWLLWSRYGNPVYPFYDPWFDPVRAALGWQP